MRIAGSSPAAELGEDRLAHTVAELLAPDSRCGQDVLEVRREPSPFATLFPAEVLTVALRCGRTLRLFLKHAGPEQADHPDKQRRDREVHVYERLLRHPELPVVRYYGARRNDATGRHELYLEYADDWNLKYHDLEHWFTAARRLADLHAHFAGRASQLLGCDFLLRLDEEYFVAWARRARAAVGSQLPALGERLAAVVEQYGLAAVLLAAQPVTLVHNDLSPKNVIACRDRTPPSIYFVDWELAGVGCGLLDLVHLKYGLSANDDRRMVVEYRGRLRNTTLLPPGETEFDRLLAACELHKTLYRLAHSASWDLPPERLVEWVEDAERSIARVNNGEARRA
jgi:hypothetical protein